MRTFIVAAAVLLAPSAIAQTSPAASQTDTPPGEEEVDPYTVSNANAGAAPFAGKDMLEAFHGVEGIGRVVDDLVDAVQKDSRISKIFKASDFVRLRRTLKEQFCYILNGGCDYTGRDMTSVHADHGIISAEFNALVELLQDAMAREGVPFGAQNRLLAKLAPMKRDAVTR
jgi:hemoglobin